MGRSYLLGFSPCEKGSPPGHAPSTLAVIHYKCGNLLALSPLSSKKPPPPLSSTSAACTLRSGRLPSPHPTVPLRFRPLLQLPHFGPPVANTTLPSNVNCFSSISFIWRGLAISVPTFCFPPILSIVHLSSLSLLGRIEHGLGVVV